MMFVMMFGIGPISRTRLILITYIYFALRFWRGKEQGRYLLGHVTVTVMQQRIEGKSIFNVYCILSAFSQYHYWPKFANWCIPNG